MGMFDNIKTPEIKCYKCGTVLKHWQSKDGEQILALLDFRAVDRFYDMCSKCHAWNEYVYKKKDERKEKRQSCVYCGREAPDESRTVEDYELITKNSYEDVDNKREIQKQRSRSKSVGY